jgi:hypothetical protein
MPVPAASPSGTTEVMSTTAGSTLEVMAVEAGAAEEAGDWPVFVLWFNEYSMPAPEARATTRMTTRATMRMGPTCSG